MDAIRHHVRQLSGVAASDLSGNRGGRQLAGRPWCDIDTSTTIARQAASAPACCRPLRPSDIVRTSFIGVLVLFLVAFHIVPIDTLWAQVPGTTGHEHLTEVACVDVPPGEAPGVWLLQRGHGNRTSFQSGIRLLASAHVSKQEGRGGGQECDGNRGGGRRASVALGIRGPKQCATGR
jgi:hypothetical protein